MALTRREIYGLSKVSVGAKSWVEFPCRFIWKIDLLVIYEKDLPITMQFTLLHNVRLRTRFPFVVRTSTKPVMSLPPPPRSMSRGGGMHVVE